MQPNSRSLAVRCGSKELEIGGKRRMDNIAGPSRAEKCGPERLDLQSSMLHTRPGIAQNYPAEKRKQSIRVFERKSDDADMVPYHTRNSADSVDVCHLGLGRARSISGFR